MNMEHNAHTSYDDLEWGIEAKEGAILQYARLRLQVSGSLA